MTFISVRDEPGTESTAHRLSVAASAAQRYSLRGLDLENYQFDKSFTER